MVLASSLGIGALLNEGRGQVRVKETLKLGVTYYLEGLDGVESAKASCGSGGVLWSRILT